MMMGLTLLGFRRTLLYALRAVGLDGDVPEPSFQIFDPDVVAFQWLVVHLVCDFAPILKESRRQFMEDLHVHPFYERSRTQFGEIVFLGDVGGQRAVVDEVEEDVPSQVLPCHVDGFPGFVEEFAHELVGGDGALLGAEGHEGDDG